MNPQLAALAEFVAFVALFVLIYAAILAAVRFFQGDNFSRETANNITLCMFLLAISLATVLYVSQRSLISTMGLLGSCFISFCLVPLVCGAVVSVVLYAVYYWAVEGKYQSPSELYITFTSHKDNPVILALFFVVFTAIAGVF